MLCGDFLPLSQYEVPAVESWPEEPQITSPNAIVMELSTGTVLYEKNSHEQHYPASTTKIMTTMLALENSEMDETVTFSHDAVFKTEGSGIARDVDEQMSMKDTLYAVMLESANECAYAVAEHVGGTYEEFVDMMNERAAELGCTDTHFNNPHGLTDPDHYTSCYDLALIAREAYKNETFRTITATPMATIPPTNKHEDITYLHNHNKLIHSYRDNGEYIYEYCVGGKTGYTEAANSTLVSYAQKDGMTLICVIMNTHAPAQWNDTIALYEYYLNNFAIYNVADNETRLDSGEMEVGRLNTNESYVKLDPEAAVVLPKTTDFASTEYELDYDTEAEDALVTIRYTLDGREVGKADIVATKNEVDTFDFDNLNKEQESVEGKKKVIKVQYIIFGILGVAALGILIWLIKLFADNFYIIRHNYFSSPKRDSRYKVIKNTYRSRRRRRGFRRKRR